MVNWCRSDPITFDLYLISFDPLVLVGCRTGYLCAKALALLTCFYQSAVPNLRTDLVTSKTIEKHAQSFYKSTLKKGYSKRLAELAIANSDSHAVIMLDVPHSTDNFTQLLNALKVWKVSHISLINE